MTKTLYEDISGLPMDIINEGISDFLTYSEIKTNTMLSKILDCTYLLNRKNAILRLISDSGIRDISTAIKGGHGIQLIEAIMLLGRPIVPEEYPDMFLDAIRSGDVQVIDLLISKNLHESFGGTTPICEIINNSPYNVMLRYHGYDKQILDRLVPLNINMRLCDEDGRTVLFTIIDIIEEAVMEDQREELISMFRLMLKKGADPNAIISWNTTPLMKAITNDNPDIAHILIEETTDDCE